MRGEGRVPAVVLVVDVEVGSGVVAAAVVAAVVFEESLLDPQPLTATRIAAHRTAETSERIGRVFQNGRSGSAT